MLGINPWVETVVPQILLLVVTIIIFIVHFRKEKKAKEAGITMAEVPAETEEPAAVAAPAEATQQWDAETNPSPAKPEEDEGDAPKE